MAKEQIRYRLVYMAPSIKKSARHTSFIDATDPDDAVHKLRNMEHMRHYDFKQFRVVKIQPVNVKS